MRIDAVLRHVRQQLAAANIDTPDLDARLIVEHFTGTTRAEFIARPDTPIDPETITAIELATERHLAGEPVHRILGHREFYGLKLSLSPETLEPRPDTETLVDSVLPFAHEAVLRNGHCHILDLGTGTGAIALALLANVPQARAVGVDVSADALETARRNAGTLTLADRFETLQSDWFDKISGSYDVIVSNPPYIKTEDLAGLAPGVRNHDPIAALDGGTSGLEAYRRIAAGSFDHLAAGGIVAVEIGHDQQQDVTRLFTESGFDAVERRRDLGGNDRVIVFKTRRWPV